MNNLEELDIHLQIPDLWQQEALRLVNEGRDVVVHAPTGAGKTYLVELLAQGSRSGQIVHTVPTRALANDKAREWRAKGWRVGIVTGDVSIDADSPLVVATLETQKQRLIQGKGPKVLVIDEYQMLGDSVRGINYELAIAMAPDDTRLLLLSGSVSNTGEVVDWLRRLGRDAQLVSTERRPVPLEELFLDALPGRPPKTVVGFWPRQIAKALMADLGPILVFAPQRKLAERLAKQFARMLPCENPIALSPRQKKLAGKELAKLIESRVAYHHSGLNYQQRAGLIEPLAKAGQLRIVVATTGLAAGVNFSMRSVVVTESEYTVDYAQVLIRPDELLQMFGRAGRRGMDTVGYALVAPDRPRLGEGRSLPVRRPELLDWPSLIGLMDLAGQLGANPFAEAVKASARLFNADEYSIGVERSLAAPGQACEFEIDRLRSRYAQPIHMEMLNTRDVWEPMPELGRVTASRAFIAAGEECLPLLSNANEVRQMGRGALHVFKTRAGRRLGKRIVVARRNAQDPGLWKLSAWWRESLAGALKSRVEAVERIQSLESLGSISPDVLSGTLELGTASGFRAQGSKLSIIVDLRNVEVDAFVDACGNGIVNPVTRKAYALECCGCSQRSVCEKSFSGRSSPAAAWHWLGLIDGKGRVTRRGRVFSFFQGGEGLAIAAALEDGNYAVDAIAHDIANLRAGFRFDDYSQYSFRLSRACRKAFGDRSFEGYLAHGLPLQYGDGAAEVIASSAQEPRRARGMINEVLKPGDIQRVRLEWLSLLRNISNAPAVDWNRWLELQQAARSILKEDDTHVDIDNLPPLEGSQKGRANHRLRFRPI